MGLNHSEFEVEGRRDDLFDALAHSRRRFALRNLDEAGVVSYDALDRTVRLADHADELRAHLGVAASD